jgi:hypothetical protein
MCDAFEIPQGAKPARYVLAISRGERVPAGGWSLKRSRPASRESEPDFGLKEQLQLLEAGVAAWNAWRAKSPKAEVQLASEKLNDRDLKGINLSGANLERANFSGSDLTNANFSKALPVRPVSQGQGSQRQLQQL